MATRRMMGIGSADDGVGEGSAITVTWGEELYAPIQYQSFRSGAVSLSGVIEPGETYAEAHARLLAEVRKMAAEQFKQQLADFLTRVREASAATRGGR